ncbi:MAG: hypothetical protein ACE5D6_03790 [Candidatus Zixiibacteriota bacterium]
MKALLIKTFGLLFVVCSTAFGQVELVEFEAYNFDFTGGGARAEGMGKAFLGISNDITGGSWNPAGIYEFEKPVLGISWASLTPRGTSNTTVLSSNLFESDHSGSFNTVGSINFLAPVRIKGHPFVGSFNYVRSFDVFEQFQWTYSGLQPFRFSIQGITFIDDTLLLEQTGEFTSSGGLNTVNFAFGTRFYNNISFGVSANVYTSNSVNEINQNTTVYDWFYDITQRADSNTLVTVIDTNKFSGVNFTIGFKYSGNKLDIGFITRTAFELKVKTEQSIFMITRFKDMIVDDGTDTTYYGDILTKYEIPWIFGVGFGYHVNENFLLALDGEYRKFNGSKVRIRESITINPGGANEETYKEINPGWNNSFVLRFGSEYLWQSSIGEIPIRTGFGFVPIPSPNISINGDSTTAVNYNFSVGTGIHWEQIYLDVAYSYSFLERELGEFNNLVTDYKNKNHHFNFSFTGIF